MPILDRLFLKKTDRNRENRFFVWLMISILHPGSQTVAPDTRQGPGRDTIYRYEIHAY
jgi:hypothetical protein